MLTNQLTNISFINFQALSSISVFDYLLQSICYGLVYSVYKINLYIHLSQITILATACLLKEFGKWPLHVPFNSILQINCIAKKQQYMYVEIHNWGY